jgi:phosphoglycerate kinase
MDKAVINQLPLNSLRGKRVFVRIDAEEESSSGADVSDDKLRECLATLEHLTTVGARVVIGTHLGNPGGAPEPSLKLDKLARQLSALLGRPVRKLDEAIGKDALTAVTEMRDGETIVLENLRFYPGEDANDAQFARDLAELCDIYCNDAFSLAYRGTASTVAITRFTRPSTAGLAVARELTMLEPVIQRPEAPFLGLIAGARVEEKLAILDNVSAKLNRLFIGGALAFVFLKAQGKETGAAPYDEALVPLAEDFLERTKKRLDITLPEDFMVVHAGVFKAFENSGRRGAVPEARAMLAVELTVSDLAVDVGPRTVKKIKQLIDGAHTFFWNGPLGIWEIPPYAAGTRAVAGALLEPRRQRSVVCGDSLVRAIRSFDLPVEQFRHLTTAGESSLRLLAGQALPAVAALNDEVDLVAPVDERPHKILLAVDGSEPSIEAARRIGRLVDADGAEINLLYVQKPPEIAVEDAFMDAETKRRRELERQLEAERIVAAAHAPLASQGLISHHQLVVEGDPAEEILKLAKQIGAELIAMGSRGRTGLIGAVLGSVSRKVLDRAGCPVLIVHGSSRGRAAASV